MSGFIKDGQYYESEFHYRYVNGRPSGEKGALTGGRLVVLEGGDGSGKGTQAELLMDNLRSHGFVTSLYDFPQYTTFFGRQVAKLLNGGYGRLSDFPPFPAAMFYACDRGQAAPQLRRDLNEGKVVVCNRYVASNLAHGGAKYHTMEEAEAFVREVEEMEYVENKLPVPDLTLYLDVPAETARVLIGTKGEREYVGGRKMDIAEADLSHQEKAGIMYRWLCENREGYSRVECVVEGKLLSPEAVQERVWAEVSKVL